MTARCLTELMERVPVDDFGRRQERVRQLLAEVAVTAAAGARGGPDDLAAAAMAVDRLSSLAALEVLRAPLSQWPSRRARRWAS